MDDKFDDYFNEQAGQEPEPEVQPETPREREERRIDEATIERSHNTMRTVIVTTVVVLLAVMCLWLWWRYYYPYSTEQIKGYVTSVRTEGLIKTYEGEMVKVTYVGDSFHIDEVVHFSIVGDSVMRRIVPYSSNGRRVALTVKEYKGALPWRGNSRLVATDIVPDSDRVETRH